MYLLAWNNVSRFIAGNITIPSLHQTSPPRGKDVDYIITKVRNKAKRLVPLIKSPFLCLFFSF